MITGFASRPLTFVSGPMFKAAHDVGGVIVRRRSRCGRYWTYQAMNATDGWAVQSAGAGRVVADAEDLTAYLAAHGGSVTRSAEALTAVIAVAW